jgi:hypothetical protein
MREHATSLSIKREHVSLNHNFQTTPASPSVECICREFESLDFYLRIEP